MNTSDSLTYIFVISGLMFLVGLAVGTYINESQNEENELVLSLDCSQFKEYLENKDYTKSLVKAFFERCK